MIRLWYSNRTEELARALAARIAERRDPFETVTVVVPNRPMERWVEMRLAEELGIAANLRFVRLERFVGEWLGEELLGAASIEGRLLAVMLAPGALERDPDLHAVRDYLVAGGADSDAIDRRRAQLARRLTHLFLEYGYGRPQMIEAWSRGERALEGTPFAATERWQRALFLASRGGGERTLAEALLDPRPGAPQPGERRMREAHVFGVSYVARVFHHAIAALGAATELHVYALNPCEEFWQDALSDSEQRRSRRAGAALEEDPYALLAENESSLLRAWGRPGREHIALLDELTGFDAHARFVEPDGATLLGRVQRSILHRAAVEPESEPASASESESESESEGESELATESGSARRDRVDRGGRSIRLLACPSPRREIETVATEIWSLIDAHAAGPRPYRFPEIAVLVNGPDREQYLPHLEAVFAESHDLPWSAGDLALTTRSRVADCAMRLIALPSSSFTRAEVLEVIAHPLVLARWPDAEAARVATLCDRLGVFHGIDAADHQGTYLASSAAGVHWDQAIRRLALGAMLEGERHGSREPFVDRRDRLWPEEISLSDDLGCGLGLLVRSLAADARFARSAQLTPTEWSVFLRAMLTSYVVPTDPAEESDLRRCLAAIAAIAEREAGVKVGYRIAAELAESELEALSASRGGGRGEGVVVASLLPMRAIPFRAIFVLGLGEGRFPGRELDTGLDLRAAQRRPGDVAQDERDRYTFLETLLCARESLVLSYVARDETSGEARQPSSIVHAIEEAIGAPLERTTPPLRRHEIHLEGGAPDPIALGALPAAASEAHARASGAAHRPALADARFPERALAALPEDDPRRALLGLFPIPAASEAGGGSREGSERGSRVSLDQIRRFLECPIQGHARIVIGASEDAPDEAVEDEPFEASELERDRVLIDVLLATLGQSDDEIAREYAARVERSVAHGAWPLGPFAELAERGDREMLAAWRRAIGRWGPDARVHRIRFGGGAERADGGLDRPRDPLALTIADRTIELVGRTGLLLPSGDTVIVTRRSAEGDGERAKVDQRRHALRAFVDHAALASAEGSVGSRRAWVIDGPTDLPLAIHLAPMRKAAAERWLAGVLEDLGRGPHGLFFPCEAVLRAEWLFGGRGSDRPSEDLARMIEEVRTKSPWHGGSSRYGPVRGAIEHPAPEPGLALAMASRRYAAFFDHLRGIRRAA
jgi:exodeoxyribonuclease V gamma subunit